MVEEAGQTGQPTAHLRHVVEVPVLAGRAAMAGWLLARRVLGGVGPSSPRAFRQRRVEGFMVAGAAFVGLFRDEVQ